ncbi:MAG TPA: threonine ammonia-lyase [Dehalococcoidia bacterium]|nr:threonine ammonia-lyase [Dehalococcoidia bacterium]
MAHDITIADIEAARTRFGSFVRRTPLLPSSSLGRLTGGEVWLKAESLQHTGSFKVRGAMNRIALLSPDERRRGVVAASAGNHAQGVAVAARAHGVGATIVMPVTTPLAKVEATRGYGADVVLCGDSYECAHSEAERIARDRGLTMIPAYDDAAVIAGQGTLGLEIVEDLPDVDLVLVPVGGGGLAAGIGVALRAKAPAARIVGVQVEAAPGVARSLEARALHPVPPAPTIAEGVAVAGPGEITFPLLRRVLDGVVLVGEDDVAQAIVYLLERAKLVVEGAGAVGVAALLSGLAPVKGQRVVALLSGGNVDINMLARVVEHGLMRAGRYFSLTVGMDDRPGQLAELAELIAGTGANVLSVAHHRFGIALPVGRVEVVLLLEVRNRDHGVEVERALAAHGFVRNAEAGPQFVPADWVQGRP